MDKERSLKLSQCENVISDKKEDYEADISFGFGGITVGVFCLFFSILNMLKGQGFYEFGVILFGYMATVSWRTYYITKRKCFLYRAIVCSIAVILAMVGYFLVF